jgi:peroxiredoxin
MKLAFGFVIIGIFTALPNLVYSTEGTVVKLNDALPGIHVEFEKNTPFLSIADLMADSLMAIQMDQESGLLVLCTVNNCQALFMQDETEVLWRNEQIYVQAKAALALLDCSCETGANQLKIKCPEPLLRQWVGANVGEHAPGFKLDDTNHTPVVLSALWARGPVVVLFVRSGDWDPISQRLLSQAQANVDSLHAHGVTVVAIHGYSQKIAEKWGQKLKLTYPLLSDAFAAVMRGYDVFDKGHLPRNAVFVLSPKGMIQFRQEQTEDILEVDWGKVFDAVKK